jgi:hypothetical protein
MFYSSIVDLYRYIKLVLYLLPFNLNLFQILFLLADKYFFMAKTELHPDQMYIEGLANNNSAVIQSIYKSLWFLIWEQFW